MTSQKEIIYLPDKTEVHITRDIRGNIIERKEIPPYTEKVSQNGEIKVISRYRKNGTLWLVRKYDKNGKCTAIEYDKTGKKPVCTVFEQPPSQSDPDVQLIISKEAKELVKSAELLSRKRKKYHITSILKERG